MSLSGVLPLLQRRREFLFVSEALAHRRRPWVTGPAGAAKACLIAAQVAHHGAAVLAWLVLAPHRDEAERLADDLSAFLPPGGHEIHLLAAWEGLGPEDPPSIEAEGARQRLLDAVTRGVPVVAVAPPAAFLARMPDRAGAAAARVALRPGLRVRLEDVLARLAAGGYERTDLVQAPGDVAVRGGLIDVFPSTGDRAVRIEWIGDEVESVRTFDPETQRTVAPLDEAIVLAARPAAAGGVPLPQALGDPVCVVDEPDDVEHQARVLYARTAAAYRRAIETERIPAGTAVPLVPWETRSRPCGAPRRGAPWRRRSGPSSRLPDRRTRSRSISASRSPPGAGSSSRAGRRIASPSSSGSTGSRPGSPTAWMRCPRRARRSSCRAP